MQIRNTKRHPMQCGQLVKKHTTTNTGGRQQTMGTDASSASKVFMPSNAMSAGHCHDEVNCTAMPTHILVACAYSNGW
jgi:hypothetical protein